MKSFYIHFSVLITSILVSSVTPCLTQSEFEALPEFLVDKEFITVSGVSAGGAFATQVSKSGELPVLFCLQIQKDLIIKQRFTWTK